MDGDNARVLRGVKILGSSIFSLDFSTNQKIIKDYSLVFNRQPIKSRDHNPCRLHIHITFATSVEFKLDWQLARAIPAPIPRPNVSGQTLPAYNHTNNKTDS
jgi:hypothetical protein